MTSEELDTIVRKHEMQRLELKESFSTECIETACAFTNAQGGFVILMKPTHPARPRNKIIAQAFFDMGIIERYGSGIKRIKGDCDKNGNPYPEWSDRYGEFATTYRPRAANGEGRMDDTAQSTTQSATNTTQSTTQSTTQTKPGKNLERWWEVKRQENQS